MIKWDSGGYALQPGPYMEAFRESAPWTGDEVTLSAKTEELAPYRRYPLLLERKYYSVYNVNGERLVLYHWSYLRDGYAIWLDRIDQNRDEVCMFDPGLKTQIPIPADWFFGVCGLQRAFLNRGKPILHASYVQWKNHAILFTAPSGTGKTTQAKLWEQYADAKIINGDRVLLGEREGVWHAYGYPNCGSSDICVNRTLPIRAIVVLQQGKENRVQRMTASEKLRGILSGTVVYHWDGADVQRAAVLAGEILSSVPVVRLICRPDADAVYVLKNYLEEEAIW